MTIPHMDLYKNYFISMDPKIIVGGRFVAHNVTQNSRDMRDFVTHIQSLDNYQTTFDPTSREGISISHKTKEDF